MAPFRGLSPTADLRRLIGRKQSIFDLKATEVMTPNPLTAGKATAAYDALNVMEQHQITVLPVVDPSGRVEGILHLHDILGKGEFTFNGS